MKSKILVNFSIYTDGNLETKAEQILQNMTNNSAYTDSIPNWDNCKLLLKITVPIN